MFGKLWEWIMGIIAWIMSFFSRKSEGGAQSEDAPQAESVAEPEVKEPANSEWI